MKLLKIALAGASAAALALGQPARAADDSVTAKNAGLATITFCSKDTGSGVMASCTMPINTSGVKVNPATSDAQATGNASLTSIDGKLSGCTPSGLSSAATTNATSVKASAGTFCGGVAINTTATVYYLRLYNLAAAPTCSSATGFVATIPIPASTTGAGTLLSLGPFGADFTTGIAYCLTAGGASTNNTAAATGVYLTYTYR